MVITGRITNLYPNYLGNSPHKSLLYYYNEKLLYVIAIVNPCKEIPQVFGKVKLHLGRTWGKLANWNGHQLIGIARGLTDWCYFCYLSDLAVDPKYQRSGIGTALLDRVREEIGDAVTLILVSAPDGRSVL
jgi:ribosomal protein S18 acetylase RimI-like enzyme